MNFEKQKQKLTRILEKYGRKPNYFAACEKERKAHSWWMRHVCPPGELHEYAESLGFVFSHSRRARPVITSTGQWFPSVSSAASALKIAPGTIRHVCEGIQHTAKGISFRWATEMEAKKSESIHLDDDLLEHMSQAPGWD